MTVVEKIMKKQADIYSAAPITIAFLGDSVTQGCFELYPVEPGNLNTVYDPESAYHNRVKQILKISEDDYHFRRQMDDGKWYEKCGSGPIRECTDTVYDEDWWSLHGQLHYDSNTVYLAVMK